MTTLQRNSRRRILIIFLAVIVISIALFIAYYVLFNDHFRTVIPGQVYRSGEMSQQGFEDTIKKYHIKSIINLRGYDQGDAWFDNEIKAVKATGIQHYDVRLPPQGLPEPWRIARLVQVIETAPRPVLLHCTHGVDRSGFASAIVIILTGDPSWKDVTNQYSFRYLRVDPRSIGPTVMPYYEKWSERNNLVYNRDNFLHWVHAVAAANTFDP